MPKIYIKSKDVAGADVVEYDGVCYTRTGNTFKANSVSLTNASDVIKYFTDCDGCATGQSDVAVGSTVNIPNSATSFQFKFAGAAEGDTATLDLSGATTCSVLLSVNGDNNLVFDAATPPTGNGPHVFTSVPQTISYVDCQTHTYDITLASLGSYVLTGARTGTGGVLPEPADSATVTTTFSGTELSALSASEQAALIASINTTITNTASADIDTVTTTLSDGSIIAKSIIRYIAAAFNAASSALETMINDGSLVTAIVNDINNDTVLPQDIKDALVAEVSAIAQVSAPSTQPGPTPTPTAVDQGGASNPAPTPTPTAVTNTGGDNNTNPPAPTPTPTALNSNYSWSFQVAADDGAHGGGFLYNITPLTTHTILGIEWGGVYGGNPLVADAGAPDADTMYLALLTNDVPTFINSHHANHPLRIEYNVDGSNGADGAVGTGNSVADATADTWSPGPLPQGTHLLRCQYHSNMAILIQVEPDVSYYV